MKETVSGWGVVNTVYMPSVTVCMPVHCFSGKFQSVWNIFCAW